MCVSVTRASKAERDSSMKRQLVEEMKNRMKLLQEREKSHTAELNQLEHKVGTTTTEHAPTTTDLNLNQNLNQDLRP